MSSDCYCACLLQTPMQKLIPPTQQRKTAKKNKEPKRKLKVYVQDETSDGSCAVDTEPSGLHRGWTLFDKSGKTSMRGN